MRKTLLYWKNTGVDKVLIEGPDNVHLGVRLLVFGKQQRLGGSYVNIVGMINSISVSTAR